MPAAEELIETADGEEPDRWSLTVASRTTRAHGRRTIAKLLDAAVAEFGSHGYHGASMARIAKRAGTAHGTVYLHFADKDDLLAAAMADVTRDLAPATRAVPVLEPGAAGLALLQAWLVDVCRRFQTHGALLQAISEAFNTDPHTPAGVDSLREMNRSVAAIADRIRATGASGVDPKIAALAIYAVIEGANRAMFRGQLLASTDELAQGLAEFIQRSLFGT
ncbi:MAG TPA: TetR/AcrR family transcriptional regulator [Acidimicrobiales bacterium]|nr:TetR/AcrR family transcriptional regulator [Acidimicrobiales bacterium]